MYYINVFIIYSIIGFFYESIITYIRKGIWNSGIMYGIWTPIYGVGSLIIIILSKYISNILLCVIIIMLLLTILEYITGILIEKVFHVVFWDYSEFKYHFGYYICLEVTCLWGILSLIVIYIINPFISLYINEFPKYISLFIVMLMIIDLYYTCKVKYKTLKK